MKKYKTLKILPAAALTLAVFTQGAFAANNYSDLSGHWNRENILKWQSRAVISGYDNGTFQPDRATTRAEFSAIVSRVFGFPASASTAQIFTDVAGDAWYAQAVGQMQQAKVISGYSDGTFRPDQYITRQEAAVVLARAFEVSAADGKALAAFTDHESVADWAAADVAGLVENGYLKGSDNRLNAGKSITRAELVMLIEQMAGDIWSVEGTEGAAGSLVVNTPSAVLKDITVAGDLYLTQGASNAVLENVKIGGRLIVLGGEGTVQLRGSTAGKQLIVSDRTNSVKIVADASTKIAGTLLKSGAVLQNNGAATNLGAIEIHGAAAAVQLSGDFDTVTVAKEKPQVSLSSGVIRRLVIDAQAQQAAVSVAADARVQTLAASAASKISGSGKIDLADISAAGVSSEITPAKITLAKDTSATIAGKVVSSSTASSGGSSSGGSSSGGSQQTSFVKSAKISTIGTVRYVSVVFTTGTRADYTFFVDGADVSADVTNVTDTGSVVKYELQDGQKTLVIKNSAGVQRTVSLL